MRNIFQALTFIELACSQEVRMARRMVSFLVLGVFLAVPVLGGDSGPEGLLEGGHWKRLRAIAEPRAAANPNDAQAAYFLASVKEELGDLQGALPLAEKAVSIDPNNARYHLRLASICISLGQKAGIFKGLGLAHRFRDEAEKAVSLDPKYVDAREALMEFYFQAPGIAGGNKKKAWATAGEIGQIDAVRGLLAQASLAAKEKNPSKQEDFYQKALAAAPYEVRVLRTLAGFYVSDLRKKYDLAEKYALEALKLDETRVGPYVVLAIAYATGERWQDLDTAMARAEKNVPDDYGPHYQAGKVLLLSGKDLPRAERYFRKYLTMEPEGGEPNHAAAHWRLGLVLEKEGKKPEAIAEMEEALRVQPEFKQAKEDLKRLKK
jgi:tetratricopeptide (TPR) repeat protein